jgi:hypothetical protein
VSINHATSTIDCMRRKLEKNLTKLPNLHALKPENATKANQHEISSDCVSFKLFPLELSPLSVLQTFSSAWGSRRRKIFANIAIYFYLLSVSPDESDLNHTSNTKKSLGSLQHVLKSRQHEALFVFALFLPLLRHKKQFFVFASCV